MDAFVIRTRGNAAGGGNAEETRVQGVKRNVPDNVPDTDNHQRDMERDLENDSDGSAGSDATIPGTHEVYDVTTTTCNGDDKTIHVPGKVLVLFQAICYTPEERAVRTDVVDYNELMCGIDLARHYLTILRDTDEMDIGARRRAIDAHLNAMTPGQLFQVTNVVQALNFVPYILPAARCIANLIRNKTPAELTQLFACGTT